MPCVYVCMCVVVHRCVIHVKLLIFSHSCLRAPSAWPSLSGERRHVTQWMMNTTSVGKALPASLTLTGSLLRVIANRGE